MDYFSWSYGWKWWFSGLSRFSMVERPSLWFLNMDWARVMTNCYWNLFKHHIIQFLWKFEEDWNIFHEVMAENDDFLDLVVFQWLNGRHFDFWLWTGPELWQIVTGICLSILKVQFLWKFEEDWTIFHEVMAENDHFWNLSFFWSFDG